MRNDLFVGNALITDEVAELLGIVNRSRNFNGACCVVVKEAKFEGELGNQVLDQQEIHFLNVSEIIFNNVKIGWRS